MSTLHEGTSLLQAIPVLNTLPNLKCQFNIAKSDRLKVYEETLARDCTLDEIFETWDPSIQKLTSMVGLLLFTLYKQLYPCRDFDDIAYILSHIRPS